VPLIGEDILSPKSVTESEARQDMTKLMEKKDWLGALADVESAKSIWCENVSGNPFEVSIPLPEAGRYRVIFVKLDDLAKPQPVSRKRRDWEISPKVRALRGAAHLDDTRDYKAILADALNASLQ
jgi:hypothetical protein